MSRKKDAFSFIYGDKAIAYHVIWTTENKAGKITIKIHPNGDVMVSSPEGASPEQIHQAVIKRARWIWQSLEVFRINQSLLTDKHYRSGEMMFYLGRRYVLKLIETDDKPSVKLTHGQLQVFLPSVVNSTSEQVKNLVNQWYRQQAQRVFTERLTTLAPQTDWVKKQPEFKILSMQKQWGSCSIQGCLMLNPHLIKAPKECIDYVMLHELCHLSEHNHSERFWRLLTQVMPHWKEVKSKLDGMAELYLN